MTYLLFESRASVYRRHDRRLREKPNPTAARRNFARRVRTVALAEAILGFLYLVAYSSLLATMAGLVLGQVVDPVQVRTTLGALTGAASTFAFASIVSIQVANRFLTLASLEVSYYSAESRMRL